MSIVLPLVAAFLGIGLFAKRLDFRTYLLMVVAIAVVTALRYIRG